VKSQANKTNKIGMREARNSYKISAGKLLVSHKYGDPDRDEGITAEDLKFC